VQDHIRAPNGYRCFVIGPIGDELAPIGSPEHDRYEEALEVLAKVIEPACSKYGIVVERADGIQKRGEIPEQVVEAIRDYELVVADLSGANPNVMYELALRHAVGKCSIEISEWERLPFDIQWIRTLQFVRAEQGFIDARKRLEKAIEAFLAVGCGEVTATRVLRGVTHSVTPPISPTERMTGRVLDAGELLVREEEEPEELGFLDILLEMEEAMPLMSTDLQQIGALVVRLGEIATDGKADIDTANAQGGGSVSARMPAIVRFSERIGPVVEELEGLVAQYTAHIDSVDRGITFLIDRMATEEELKAQARDFPRTIVRLRGIADDSLTSLDNLASTIATLAPMSRVLRGPATRLASSLSHVRLASAPIFRWADSLVTLFPELVG